MTKMGVAQLRFYFIIALLLLSPFGLFQIGSSDHINTDVMTTSDIFSLSEVEQDDAISVEDDIEYFEDESNEISIDTKDLSENQFYEYSYSANMPEIQSSNSFYTQFDNGILQLQGGDEFLTLSDVVSNPSSAMYSYSDAIVKVKNSHVLMVLKVDQTELSTDLTNLLNKNDVTIDRYYPKLSAYTLYVPTSLLDVGHNDFIKKITDDPVVEYIQPSVHYTLDEFIPNDPYWPDLYGMQMINMPQAWDITFGAPNITVAVIDTGIDYNHEDLIGRYIGGYDYYYNDNDPMDGHGHGTHVSGTIAGLIDNGIGVTGVGNFSILAYKIFGDGGEYSSDVDAADALISGVDAGAKVLSNSWGGGPNSQIINDAIDYARENNVLPVFAAGNWGVNEPHYPGAYGPSLAVGATDWNDELASFSNYGDWVDLVAPGVDIWSSLPGNSYAAWSGTSMATPHVSGVAALLYAQYPELGVDGIEDLLLESVVDLGDPGFDIYYGYGRLDAYTALLGPPDHDLKASLSGTGLISLGDTGQIELSITNRGTFDEYNINATLLEDGIEIMSVELPELLAGDTYSDSFVITPTELGVLTYSLYVDPIPNEQRFDNNEAFFSVTVSDLRNYFEFYPEFQWYDAQGNGELLLQNCDDCAGAVNLPFNFPFYDQYFSTAYVSSNGWVSFDNPNPFDYYNSPFPLADSYFWYMIAGLWDDLYLTGSGAVYSWVTDEFAVFEYNNVDYINGNFLGSFEIVLFANGLITINFDYLDYYQDGTTGLNYGINTLFYNQFYDLYAGLTQFSLGYTLNLDPYFELNTDVLDLDLNFDGTSDTLQSEFRSDWYQENQLLVEVIFDYYWYNPTTNSSELVETRSVDWTAQGRDTYSYSDYYQVPQNGDYQVDVSVFLNGTLSQLDSYSFTDMDIIYENIIFDTQISAGDIDNDGLNEEYYITPIIYYYVETSSLFEFMLVIEVLDQNSSDWYIYDAMNNSIFIDAGSSGMYSFDYLLSPGFAADFRIRSFVFRDGELFGELTNDLYVDALDETLTWWYNAYTWDIDGDTLNDTISVEIQIYWQVFTIHYLEFILDVEIWDNSSFTWVPVDQLYLNGEIGDEYTFFYIYEYSAMTEGTYRIQISIQYDYQYFDGVEFEFFLYESAIFAQTYYDLYTYDTDNDGLEDTVDITIIMDYSQIDLRFVDIYVDTLWYNDANGYYEYVDGYYDYFEIIGNGSIISAYSFTARMEGDYIFVISVYIDGQQDFYQEASSYLYASASSFEWYSQEDYYDRDGDGFPDSMDFGIFVDYYGSEYVFAELIADLYFVDNSTGNWIYITGFYDTEDLYGERHFGVGMQYNAEQEGDYVVVYTVYINGEFGGSSEVWTYLWLPGDFVNYYVGAFPEDRDGNGMYDSFYVYFDVEAYVSDPILIEMYASVSIWDNATSDWVLVDEFYQSYDIIGQAYLGEYYQYFAEVEGEYLVEVLLTQDTEQLYADQLIEYLAPLSDFAYFYSYADAFDSNGDGLVDTAYLDWYVEYYQSNSSFMEVFVDIYTLNGTEWVLIDFYYTGFDAIGYNDFWDYFEYPAPMTGDYLFEFTFWIDGVSHGEDSYFFYLYETSEFYFFYNEVYFHDYDGDGYEDSAEVIGWIEHDFTQYHTVEIYVNTYYFDEDIGDWVVVRGAYSGPFDVIGTGGSGFGYQVYAENEGQYMVEFIFYLDYNYEETQITDFYLFQIGEFAEVDIWGGTYDNDGDTFEDTIFVGFWYILNTFETLPLTLLVGIYWFNEDTGEYEFVDLIEQTTQVSGFVENYVEFTYTVEQAGNYLVFGSAILAAEEIAYNNFEFYDLSPIEPFLYWEAIISDEDTNGDGVADGIYASMQFSFYLPEPILFELYINVWYMDNGELVHVGDYESGFYGYGLVFDRSFMRYTFLAPFEGEFMLDYYMVMNGELVDYGSYVSSTLETPITDIWAASNIPLSYYDNDFDGTIDTFMLDFYAISSEDITMELWYDIYWLNEETGENEFVETIYKNYVIEPRYSDQYRIGLYYPYAGSYQVFLTWIIAGEALFDALPLHDFFPQYTTSTGLNKDYGPSMYGLDNYDVPEGKTEHNLYIFDYFTSNFEVYLDGILMDGWSLPVNYGEGAYNVTFTLDIPFGWHNVTVVAYDIFGNTNEFCISVFARDMTPPSIEGPAEVSFEESPEDAIVLWTVEDPNLEGFLLMVNDFNVSAEFEPGQNTVQFNFADYPAGQYYILLYVWDSFGNEAMFETIVMITPDATPPILTDQVDMTYEQGSTGNVLNWTASDFYPDYYEVYLDGSLMMSNIWTSDEPMVLDVDGFSYGTYSIEMIVYDMRGNSASDGVTLTVVDTTSPTVITDQVVIFSHKSTENLLYFDLFDENPASYELIKLEWRHDEVISWGDWTSGIMEIDLGRLHVGLYFYEFRATDELGNTTEVTIIVLVASNDHGRWKNFDDYYASGGSDVSQIDLSSLDFTQDQVPEVNSVQQDEDSGSIKFTVILMLALISAISIASLLVVFRRYQ